MKWLKKSLLAIPVIYSCDVKEQVKTVIENHAEKSVKIEAVALITKKENCMAREPRGTRKPQLNLRTDLQI